MEFRVTDEQRAAVQEWKDRRIIADAPIDRVGEYAVPVDPMDELGCDSCQ